MSKLLKDCLDVVSVRSIVLVLHLSHVHWFMIYVDPLDVVSVQQHETVYMYMFLTSATQ